MSDTAAHAIVECRGITKRFVVPRNAETTLRGRIFHPFRRTEIDEFTALDNVSFTINRGEFFGIVGRNGSGKSTLLKVLAGIYEANGGSLSVGGSIAPFIELGVGFNMELSARDNVYINGAVLGLGRRAMTERLPAIVAFAELGEFMEMKLRNFSSGMLMRLAFAIAVQADADILLVDEVLAVGDERFQRKCADVFRERRRNGRTVVFVSHDMSAVESLCDRALVLDHGKIVALGPATEVVPTYHRLNRDADDAEAMRIREAEEAAAREQRESYGEVPARPNKTVIAPEGDESDIKVRWRSDASAHRLELGPGAPIEVHVRAGAARGLTNEWVRLLVFNETGTVVGEAVMPWSELDAADITVDNVFTAGRYRIVTELFATENESERIVDSDSVEFDVLGSPAVGSTRLVFQVHPTTDSADPTPAEMDHA